MTAKELIEVLSKLDPQVQVHVNVIWPDQQEDVKVEKFYDGDDICSPQYSITSKY